jgi:hypothetical protein
MATNNGGRPLASVSLDLDNLWSYMKIRGDAGWRDRPTYLPTFVPLVLDVLDELGLRITIFVVGADAEDPRNQPYLRAIVERGHEVGNHSYEHESWLHLYSRPEIEAELARAEEAIAGATGQRPRGFRGPGFSWSPDLIDVLAERGYLFDASTLPTWIGPLARWYYFRSAQLASDDQEKRSDLFGAFSDGFRPLKPYRWSLGGERSLLEIPVTTIPLLRTPFHLSYLLYLSRISEGLMMAYLRTGLQLCRATRTAPSYLLHPLDLLSGEDAPALRFFPGMDVPAARKRELFTRVLREIGRRFAVVPMTEHAEAVLASRRVATRPLAVAERAG